MTLHSISHSRVKNDLGICTVSLGSWKHHDLSAKIRQAAKAGFRAIDLFDEDWAQYLASNGLDPKALWEPTTANIECAYELGELVKSLGMYIVCTQPLRNIEGSRHSAERSENMDRVSKRFPFMRAFDTDLVFMCSNIRKDSGVTSDFQTVVRDLQEVGDRAAAYAHSDGGKMLKIGYEGLSWANRNTWTSTWEVVRAVNRPNVGLIVDSFNLLAVEFANPYAQAGHGMFYPTLEEALDVLCSSLASFVATVPADKIYFVQLGDAQLVDPQVFLPPTDEDTPRLLPWSRMHRLYPMEQHLGGYMPIDLVTAAIIATGYKGPLSLEVFTKSLHEPHHSIPEEHAQRGMQGLQKLLEAVSMIPKFWTAIAQPTSVKWGARMVMHKNQLSPRIEDLESRL